MLRRRGLLALSLAALLGGSALAAGLYESLPAGPLPDSLPPATDGSLGESRVSLLSVYGRERFAVLELAPAKSGQLSCLWLDGSGKAALSQRGLPVSAGGTLWVTTEVPGAAGLLRLGLWEAGARADLGGLALGRPEAELSHLLDARWIDLRGQPVHPASPRLAQAWDPPLRWASPAPAGFELAPWPLAQAWLGADLSPRCKDCGLGALASGELVLDNQGPRGAWLVGWGRSLKLSLELPPGRRFTRASALVEAQAAPGFGLGSSALSLAANNWPAQDASLAALPSGGAWAAWQQVAFDLSQKLEAGLNYIELSASGTSAGECRVASVQVWVQ